MRVLCIVVIRWQGSIYKFVWRHFSVFAALYIFISVLYRFILNEDQKRYQYVLSNYETCFESIISII